MAVAKTYEKMELVGEPFEEHGRMYVQVRAPKGIKTVRWYTEAKYRRMYKTVIMVNPTMDFDARHAFGFGDEGFITIYKGRNVEEWANADRHNIYYNCTFLYYTPGRLERPRIIDGITPIKLTWEEVMDYDTRMKSHEEVKKYVDNLLLLDDNSKSQYQGVEDEWLQKEVKVREKKSRDSRYGTKHTYSLADAQGNIYIWETGAKDYENNQAVSLKMKVKEHKEINGEKVTVVWYCKEI